MTETDRAHWCLAICQDCKPVLPQPFYDPTDCADWAEDHREATGHRVVLAEEWR